MVHHVAYLKGYGFELHLSRLELGHIQKVVDQTGKTADVAGRDLEELFLFRADGLHLFGQKDVQRLFDGEQGSAHLVRDMSDELGFHLIEFFLLSDVAQDRDHSDGLALLIFNHGGACLEDLPRLIVDTSDLDFLGHLIRLIQERSFGEGDDVFGPQALADRDAQALSLLHA